MKKSLFLASKSRKEAGRNDRATLSRTLITFVIYHFREEKSGKIRLLEKKFVLLNIKLNVPVEFLS